MYKHIENIQIKHKKNNSAWDNSYYMFKRLIAVLT